MLHSRLLCWKVIGSDIPRCRAKEQQGEAASRIEKKEARQQDPKDSGQPGETLRRVRESAQPALGNALPSSGLSGALEALHRAIAQLSAADQFAANMAIGSLLTTK